MKKYFFIISFLLCIASRGLNAQVPPALANRLQTVMDSACGKIRLKGASVAIHIPQYGIWKAAYGQCDGGKPVTDDMAFSIASNTKTYVATLMLKLQEQGLVKLEDTIGTWIHNKPNISGKITIRQLLNHTSGLYAFNFSPGFSDSLTKDFTRIWHPEEMLKLVQRPYSAPGKAFSYSNTNYVVAGLIIEQILNKPIEVALREMIIDPLMLQHTAFFPQEAARATVAGPWSISFSNNGNLEDINTLYNYSNNASCSMLWASGALLATAEDNVSFWHNLFAGNLLDTASTRQMHQWVSLGTYLGHKLGYGLGLYYYNKALNGHTIYMHPGNNFGYTAFSIADSATGICISLLTNQDSISTDMLLTKVISALHKAILNNEAAGLQTALANGAAISLYPNPAKDVLYLAGQERAGLLIRLYNISGQEVLSQVMEAGSKSISLAGLAPGMYTARIIAADGPVCVKKVLIQ